MSEISKARMDAGAESTVNFSYTICGERIYIETMRKPSKINGFGNLTIAWDYIM